MCTGVTARWCPRHGTCTCPDDPTVLDGPSASHWEPARGCPLHSPESNHPLG